MWLTVKFSLKGEGAVISVVYRKLVSAAPPYPKHLFNELLPGGVSSHGSCRGQTLGQGVCLLCLMTSSSFPCWSSVRQVEKSRLQRGWG